MRLAVLLLISIRLLALDIIDRPIVFDEHRVSLTQEYIKQRYALEVNSIKIIPKIIVIHWTALDDLNQSIERFKQPTLPSDRPQIQAASSLNVSTHFMIDKKGKIYRLMDEEHMARHVIGLNYSSIGIENVGGVNDIDDLTSLQLQANIDLVSYLQEKYSSIEYLIGHFEYTHFVNHPLWLEKDSNYRTVKYDPGHNFMHKVRKFFPDLKNAPKLKP